jgi:O-6-methylguanine DNA methyltransferase
MKNSQKVSFKERVFEIVKKIKRGQTLSYKEVAKLAGNEKATRAVGAVLHTNYDPKIPCHRVIKSNGELGGYNRGVENKKNILRAEQF